MTDTFSKIKRSEIMRKVKSKNNKSTELRLIKFFKENAIKGWRRTFPLIGKPDFVFPVKRVVVFTDGCFWHGHDCRNTQPKQNESYWVNKQQRNIKRDLEVNKLLTQKRWLVIRLWECELKKESFKAKLLTILK